MGLFDHLKGHHPVGEDEARAAADEAPAEAATPAKDEPASSSASKDTGKK